MLHPLLTFIYDEPGINEEGEEIITGLLVHINPTHIQCVYKDEGYDEETNYTCVIVTSTGAEFKVTEKENLLLRTINQALMFSGPEDKNRNG